MLELRKRYESKAVREMERYNAARQALSSLEPDEEWLSRLPVLKAEHL